MSRYHLDYRPSTIALDSVPSSEAPYLTRYTGALASGAARIVNYGDSMSAPPAATTTWPYLAARDLAELHGSADTTTGVPAATAVVRFWNRSINASNMTNHIAAGLAADLAAIVPHLVIISCGLADYLLTASAAEYLANVQTGIDAIRAAAPDADILLVHQYEPQSVLWTGWGQATRARAESLARKNGCAFVSLWHAFGSTAGDGDPRGLIQADTVHPEDAGNELIWRTISRVLGVPLTAPAPVVNLGASRSNTVAEGSVLSAPLVIPGARLATFDLSTLLAEAEAVNLSGAGVTYRFRLKVAGTTVFDRTTPAVPAAGAGSFFLRGHLFAEQVGAVSIIHTQAQLSAEVGTGTATVLQQPSGGTTPIVASTLADIAIDLTVQMSGLGAACEVIWARLSEGSER